METMLPLNDKITADYNGALVRLELDQLFGFLNKMRAVLAAAEAQSGTSIMYQDAIARFVFDNQHLGGPIIAVGCHRAGLPAQLAFMTRIAGTRLFVVNTSLECLSHTRDILEKMGLNTHTTYHQGTLEDFARDACLVKEPLLLAINCNHQYDKSVEDMKSVYRLNRIPHAVALHGFDPSNDGGSGTVNGAIYDIFGKGINLVEIGEKTGRSRQMPEHDGPCPDGGLYREELGSEGVILFPARRQAEDGRGVAPCWSMTDVGNAPVGPEARKTHPKRFKTGFYERYMSGAGLDIGYTGGVEGVLPILPGAIGVGLGYPGYDGKTLPFNDNSQDYIFTSHVLEHMPDYRHTIGDWHRVVKSGGHIVIIVPHQYLYEKRSCPPSAWNRDHKRFYTPGSLLREIEESLRPNTYRIVHLRDNDDGYAYHIPPEVHSDGCYEIECVIRKIDGPPWILD